MSATSLLRFRSPMLALGLVLGLSGCMTDPPKEQPASERTSVVASYTVGASDAYKTPDSASWSRGAATGGAGVPEFVGTNEVGKEYSVAIELASGLGSEELGLDLWVRGIRTMTVYYKASGSSNELSRSDRGAVASSFALNLIKALDSSKATAPAGKAGVDSLLAQWILVSDPRAAHWKDSLPPGLVPSEVVRVVLVAAAKTGVPLAEQSKTWSLGVSLDSANGLVLELIAKAAIGSTDSAKLFPPPPVRVLDSLSLAGPLKAGGEPVKLAGRFEWNDGLGLVGLQYTVRRGSDASDAVVVTSLPVPASGDRSVSLSSASVVALASAPTGEYTIVVTAADGNGNRASTSTSFQVAVKDPDQPSAPRIRLASPADKSVVPFETSEVTTTWIVTTSQGSIDSVTVDGTNADKLDDSTWSAKVRLEPTGKAQTVVARATNSGKLSTTEAVSLTREADKIGPEIVWISPNADLDVDNGVNAVTVRIKAADASGIDTVLIAGQKPDSINAEGEWVRKVPLTVVGSPMAIEVRVVDKAGNPRVSSKNVTRGNPPTDVPPKTVLLDPASKTGTVVPFETKSITVRWMITDPYGIDSASVTVNGVKAKAEPDNKWSATVDLAAGVSTSIVLAVKNKNGVSGGDVVSVSRQADTTKPSIVFVAGARSVGFDSTEVVVSCRVAGIDSLVSVTIGGAVATLADGVHSAKVKLAVGDTRVEVVARDKASKLTTSVATIHRYPKLAIVRANSSGDTTVPYSTTSLVLWWNVWNGTKVVGAVLNQGAYSTMALLDSGVNVFKVFATDSAGKLDSLTTTVRRRVQARLDLSYGLDTAGTLPDSVVIAAASESGASLAWSMDGKAWTPFTGSFVQKTSGTAQVRAQVVGKDDKIASLKAFTLYHANRAPTVALTATSVSAKSYSGTFSAMVAKVTDWGIGDGIQTGTWEVQNFDLADTQFVSKLSIDASGKLSGTLPRDTSVVVKVRFRIKDNGGTANGGVDQSSWTNWVSISIVDTVLDPKLNVYRAIRMPDGKTWMRSNMRYQIQFPGEACPQDSCERYGIRYSVTTAFIGGATKVPAQSVCPAGWHIAQKSEWTRLFTSTMEAGASDSMYNLRVGGAWDWSGKGGSGVRPGSGRFGDFVLPNGYYAMYGDELWVWLPADGDQITEPTLYGLQYGTTSSVDQEAGGVRCIRD